MTDYRPLAVRAVYDALALRGLDAGGGFVRTSDPAAYMDEQRLKLAREAVRHLPAGASVLDAERLADDIMPMIRAAVGGTATAHGV